MRLPDAPVDRKALVLRCWRGAAGYWRSPSAPVAWLLLALSVLAVVLQLVVQYRLNFWSRDLFNAIEQKNADGADRAGAWPLFRSHRPAWLSRWRLSGAG